jgi:oligopeptide/dipeptide ABC transporter ATP-binding protein
MRLLEVHNLVKQFPKRGGLLNQIVSRVHALNGVSFNVEEGETLGVVGESGCGKSTLGKTLIRLIEPTSGEVFYKGEKISNFTRGELVPLRRQIQMIFQDPYSSLNPRLTAAAMLREVVYFHEIVPDVQVEAYVEALIAKVGLRPEMRDRYPHEFSGGQRQRLNIARALAVRPDFIVADEPVSALDVSIQAQILNLLLDLKQEFKLTVLFISHDLKVIEHFCDRMLVMYLGYVVEELPCQDVAERALHPYTQALLGSNPVDDPDQRRELTVLQGDVPSPYQLPPGCPFAGRCPLVMDRCWHEMPPLVKHGEQHRVACWAVEEEISNNKKQIKNVQIPNTKF